MITNNKQFAGFDKELLLISEGYVARPVTLSKSTVAGLQPDEKGKYIIPYGTYLYGANGESLLVNPQQEAVAVVPTVTKASGTVNSVVKVTAKSEGNLGYEVSFVEGIDNTFDVAVSGTGSAKAFEVTLPVDADGDVTVTYDDVVQLINNDMEANTYIIASIANGADGTTTAAATSSDVTISGGGSETVGDIDGILYHSVDVTLGEGTGAMIIAGYIDVDKMPQGVPGAAVKGKLPNITFARKD